MAIFAGILGHTLYNWSLEYVRASIASVVLLGEPIGSSILAFLLPWISQIPSEYTILGGAIILFGIYLTARKTNTITNNLVCLVFMSNSSPHSDFRCFYNSNSFLWVSMTRFLTIVYVLSLYCL
jgi:hypothetical protein